MESAPRERPTVRMRTPTSCSSCHRPFSARRRIALLEGPLALCSECNWHLEHDTTDRNGVRPAA
jgi:predicted CXXCH cytochrome family protein